MLSILATTFPFFALVFCGYGAGKSRLLNAHAVGGINTFVFYFALPSLVFIKMAATPFAEIFDFLFVGAYLVTGFVVFAVTASIGRVLFRATLSEASVIGLSAIFANIGFMGLPLLLAALGDTVASPIILALAADLIVFVPFTLVLINMDQDRGQIGVRLRKAFLRATLRNPVVMGMVTGVLFSAAALELAAPLKAFFGLLGAAAGPAALFVLGAALAERKLSSDLCKVGYMTFCKLLVHPLALLLVMNLFGVDSAQSTAGVLAVAMPIAAVVFVISQQYQVDTEPASAAILISTALSILTVPLAISWLAGG